MLTFYYGSGSPFSWKVWLALEHKQIPYQHQLLSFQAGDLRKPEYLAINPRHKVPAIVDEGFALYESSAIIEYLEEQYPQSGAPLWPQKARERGRARRIAAEAELYVAPAITKLTRLLLQNQSEPAAAALTEARTAIAEELQLVERWIVDPFLAGERATAADFALYPQLAFLGRIDARRPGYEARALLPAPVAEWMKRVEALPFLAKTIPPHWKE